MGLPEVKKEEKISPAKPEKVDKTTDDCEPFTGETADATNSLHNRLVHPAKIPQIVWKQTTSMVTIAISAPDVKDYSLKVKSRSVHFR